MNDIIYEPQFVLNDTKTDYVPKVLPNTQDTKMRHPTPIALTFFAGQGEEPALTRIGMAYEAATHHRTPHAAFGPIK